MIFSFFFKKDIFISRREEYTVGVAYMNYWFFKRSITKIKYKYFLKLLIFIYLMIVFSRITGFREINNRNKFKMFSKFIIFDLFHFYIFLWYLIFFLKKEIISQRRKRYKIDDTYTNYRLINGSLVFQVMNNRNKVSITHKVFYY